VGSQIVGAASFTYYGTTGNLVTVNLGTPLHELEYDKDVVRFTAVSLDRALTETVYIPGGRYTLSGDIRFHDAPRELLDLIETGLNGTALTYYHTTSATGHAAFLVEATPVRADRDLAGKGYYETRLTLASASTAGFSEVVSGTT